MKINTNSIESMAKAIAEVEGKARVRCLDAAYAAKYAKNGEALLESLRIQKASRKGCTVAISPEKVANSYRGIADGTYATLERGSSGWFLVIVRSDPAGSCAYGSSERVRVYLSGDAKAAPTITMKLYQGKALPKKRWVCWQAWILFAIIVIVGLIESP